MMPSPTSPERLRRTASNASLRGSPSSVARSLSTHSTRSLMDRIPRSERPSSGLESSPSPTSAPHVVPRDSFDGVSSPKSASNPFEGRLFDTGSPTLGRESGEFLDEVNFSSPQLGSGRIARTGQFTFQDHDDDDDDDDTAGSMQNSKYATLKVAEDHGLEEDDAFLDEKRKPQASKFGDVKKAFASIAPKKISQNYHHLREKYPRSTKWGLIVSASLVPLFLIAFIILVIITVSAFSAPSVYSTNSLDTTALEAGVWGFKFSRALNMTIINKSRMEVDFESITVDINLARVPTNFVGNGSTALDFTLGPNGDFTTFLLPMKFSYDAQADTNGDVLQVFLQGCGLVSGAEGSGVTFDMAVSGETKVFGMFSKGWSDSGVGGIMQCDKFLKDAVRIMGQLKGTKLTSK